MGFMASLERYAEVRRRYPDAEMLMGIGNLTELTAADSTGVNALLIAVCQELGVRSGADDRGHPVGARRGARSRRRPTTDALRGRRGTRSPKASTIDSSPSRIPTILTFTEEELRALQAGITDPNFRIFADREAITVLNNERFIRSTDVARSRTSSRSSTSTSRRTRSTWERSWRAPASP